MEIAGENSALIARVAESHELIERLKTEIFTSEEKQMTKRIVHKLLFYFLITLMVGCIIGTLLAWQLAPAIEKASRHSSL